MSVPARPALLFPLLAALSFAACEQKPKETPADVFRKEGNEFLKKSEYGPAAEAFRKSLEADPKQEKLWDKLAFSYLRAGKEQEAAEALLKTIEFKPDPRARAEVYRNIANMKLEGANKMEAEKYFVEAVKADPTDDASLVWLGEISSHRGGARDGRAPAAPDHLITAVGYYDKAIAVRPDELLPWVNKRIALMKLIGFEKAQMAEYEKVVQAERVKARKEAAKAQVAHHQGRVDELQAQVDVVSAKIAELQKQGKKLTR